MKKPPSFQKPRRCLLGSTDSPSKTAIWLFSVSLLSKNHFCRVSWAVNSPSSRGHVERGHSGAASLVRQGPGTRSPVPLPEEANEGRIVRGKFGILCKERRSSRARRRPRAPGSRPPAHAAPPSGASASPLPALSSPFSRKLVTTSIPGAATSGRASGPGVPERDEAADSEGDVPSAPSFCRFRFFLEDMTAGCR